LSVRNMMRNRCLSRSISDQGWSQFLSMLRYKAEWYGRTILVADRFFPSSKRCSSCGWVNESLPLSIRSWSCPSCKTKHDRDINAAKNLVTICTAGIAETYAVGEWRSQPRKSRQCHSLNTETPKFICG
jgi:putative transposase